MAILKITNELIEDQLTLLDVLKLYFDSFTEFLSDDSSLRQFSVQKEGLPNDSTIVSCICDLDENKNIRVISCK